MEKKCTKKKKKKYMPLWYINNSCEKKREFCKTVFWESLVKQENALKLINIARNVVLNIKEKS